MPGQLPAQGRSSQTALILCVGTEVAWGETINTNASWLAKALLSLGIRPTQTITVEDDPQLIHAVLRSASTQVDWVVCTGGLGPTEDDLTVSTLAQWLQTPLIEDAAILQELKDYFTKLGRRWADSNAKQALVPQGAHAVHNPVGTAPGIVWPLLDQPLANRIKGVLALPGVPREMKALWPAFADWLATQRPDALPTLVQASVELWFFGIGESVLAEGMHALLNDLYPALSAATYVGPHCMVRIRLSADTTDSTSLLNQARERLVSHFSLYFVGEGQDSTLERWIGQRLIDQGQTLAVAESCTGGLVSSKLTDVPGSSAYTLANWVTYSNAAKTDLLDVPTDIIQTHGAVSEAVAAAMACGVRQRMNTDWALSLTGIAGPEGGSDLKPVGTVCLGLAVRHSPQGAWVKTVQVNSRLSRPEIKALFANHGLFALKLALTDIQALSSEGFTFLYN